MPALLLSVLIRNIYRSNGIWTVWPSL